MGGRQGWRGEKSNSDLLEAAEKQGWHIGRTKKHIRCVPPDKTKPIVIAPHTAGDRRSRVTFLADLRRSGLVWPPPVYKKPPCPADVEVKIQECEVSSQADDLNLKIDWRKIEIENVAEGYEISELGEVLSPKGSVLLATMSSGHLRVALRVHNQTQPYKKFRLDELVCETFHGPRPLPSVDVIHLDEDRENCKAENVRWGSHSVDPGPGAPNFVGAFADVVTDEPDTEEVLDSLSEGEPQWNNSWLVPREETPIEDEDDGVKVSSVYQHNGVVVTIGPDGTVHTPDVYRDNLVQVTALAKIFARLAKEADHG